MVKELLIAGLEIPESAYRHASSEIVSIEANNLLFGPSSVKTAVSVVRHAGLITVKRAQPSPISDRHLRTEIAEATSRDRHLLETTQSLKLTESMPS